MSGFFYSHLILDNSNSKILIDLERGNILLDKDEVNGAWSSLVLSAQNEIKALNILSDWTYVSKDSFGINQQKVALNNGVKISRINLFQSQGHKDSLDILMSAQKQHLGNENFKTGLVSSDLINNGRNGILFRELGTADFLIVDDNILMINFYEEGNFGIQYSKITRDPNTIKYAIELHKNLLAYIDKNP